MRSAIEVMDRIRETHRSWETHEADVAARLEVDKLAYKDAVKKAFREMCTELSEGLHTNAEDAWKRCTRLSEGTVECATYGVIDITAFRRDAAERLGIYLVSDVIIECLTSVAEELTTEFYDSTAEVNWRVEIAVNEDGDNGDDDSVMLNLTMVLTPAWVADENNKE